MTTQPNPGESAAGGERELDRIYEVVDATDDERYWPLGVFLSRDAAMSLLDGAEPPFNDDEPESVTVEVRSRLIGFHPHQREIIASRTWVREYEDDKPDWTAHPIKLAPTSKDGEDGR